jgi:hypothetical protein
MTALFSAILRLKRLDLKEKDQVIVITDGQNNVNIKFLFTENKNELWNSWIYAY